MNAVSIGPNRYTINNRNLWHTRAAGLFWTWNLIFLTVILLGFAPMQLPDLIRSVREGVTPLSFLVQSMVLICIPVAATIIGAVFLRREPLKLFALGYVVEWPLLLILLFRFFMIREGNPAITTLLVWLAVAEAAFLWYLLDRRPDPGTNVAAYTRLAGLTLLFAGTIYAAVWLLFYVPPIASILVEFFKTIGTSIIHGKTVFGGPWYQVPLGGLVLLLYFFSGTLIVVMPVAAPVLAARAWWQSLRAILDRSPAGEPQASANRLPGALAVMLVPLAFVLVILAVNMRQPQQSAFDLLEQPPASMVEAQRLIAREDQIRAGLVNAYLSTYRYLGSAGNEGYITEMYVYSLRMQRETARDIEEVYEVVIQPFLYQPVTMNESAAPGARQFMLNEQRAASDLYERYFDQPIADGERVAVTRAVRSSSDTVQAELAWQAVDDREVHLARQEVTVSEQGDWAEVLLHEVYQNRTSQRQEVVYYFSLPESAVITGLWLGGTDDRERAFAFQVAPRGAAQAVYQNEVRYMRDPALVEQIGPRQYRLRAFPIEPRIWSTIEKRYEPGPAMHLWMSYRTLSQDGSWPLPRMAELRNVYWDHQSRRSINGQSVAGAAIDWLPERIAAAQPAVAQAHRVDFEGGVSVIARPAEQAGAASLPGNLRAAVVLDRSFSMRDRAGEVTQAMAAIRQALASAPEPDVYLTASAYRGEGPERVSLASFQPEQVIYLGGQNAAELLSQFETLSTGEDYDLILVLTDGSGYELGDGSIQVSVPDAPLWVVHLGGGFPLGYDDATQQAIQASGGGAAASVEEALARYAASRAAPGAVDVVDGYTWQTLPTGDVPAQLAASPADDGFAALAARRVLLSEMAKNKGSLEELPILDQLHELAVEQGIVTPYSSMIVLVNRSQQEMLDALSNKDDRFLREVEDIGLTQENLPMGVTGVPEPEEWLLIGLAAALLLYANRKKIQRLEIKRFGIGD